ncbi:MAG TPA: (Fe-S)-binding protein [Candidatus Baltobacteraceae bacterium]|nr:(Fe-S)-binding protein [Candidatus Baltobacteraceae bacterium]
MMTGYEACVRCGLCLPACPTYLETMTETSGPRGRISLIKAADEGELDLLSPGFVEQMSQCLDCRACEAVCPSGVPYGSMLEEMRARIRHASAATQPVRVRWSRAILLDWLFARPARLRMAASMLRFAQHSGLSALAGFFGLRELARLAPPIPGRFFVPDDQQYTVSNAAGTAMLHAGCVMHVAFPRVHEATIRMLNRARLSVVVPRVQGCCGAIAVHAGDDALARELARVNVAAFERSGADVYVVNAAGCGSTLKEYERLLHDDPAWRERAAAFAARVRDVTEVLDAMELQPPRGRIDARVTYQEPCHLVHAQRVSAAPRRLLAKIPGLRLIEMAESALCCGSAGIYNLTEPEMASRLQARKTANIKATGADIVATANPGCALQVAAGLREAGLRAEVKHIVELLDEAYSTP